MKKLILFFVFKVFYLFNFLNALELRLSNNITKGIDIKNASTLVQLDKEYNNCKELIIKQNKQYLIKKLDEEYKQVKSIIIYYVRYQLSLEIPDIDNWFNDINATDNNGWTALMHVINKNNEDLTGLLLDNGADVEIQNRYGWTSLIFAIFRDNTSIVNLLIKKNANLDIQDKNGKTPLMFAASNGNEEIIKLLIDNRVNVNIKDNNCNTALSYAKDKDWQKIVKLLSFN